MITCRLEDGKKVKLRHLSVDAIIIDGDNILLETRARHLNHAGKYCIPGGHLEFNESIQQGLLREIREETGYKAKIIELLFIVDRLKRDDRNRQVITLVFLVKLLKRIGQPDKETEKIEWFSLSKLPPKGKWAYDHFEIIQEYKKIRKKKVKLPIFISK